MNQKDTTYFYPKIREDIVQRYLEIINLTHQVDALNKKDLII